ncbi:MAG: class I SAM-dependent methyltransferase [Bacteroidota bacterium]
MKNQMECPLCKSTSELIFETKKEQKKYYHCSTCSGVFLHPNYYVDTSQEQERYETHNNDVYDPRYRKFVQPITDAVLSNFEAKKHLGLDYGCGTGPVASVVLEENGFDVNLYDPYFEPNENNLKQSYDFIICCEVMEHFYQPFKEFELLKKLLKPGGKLYCKTSILSDKNRANFKNWGYKNDPTHVFFYQKETLEYLQQKLGFSTVDIQPKLIVFS